MERGGGAWERQAGKPGAYFPEKSSASPPNRPDFERFTCKKRAKPGACVHVCQLRRPPRTLPPEQAAAATDRAMGPANSYPSNPALPPPANPRQGRRAPLPSHVTVTGAGSWGGPIGRLAGGRLCLWLPRLSRVFIVASQGCTAIYYESYHYSYFFSSASSYSFQACLPTLPGE